MVAAIKEKSTQKKIFKRKTIKVQFKRKIQKQTLINENS